MCAATGHLTLYQISAIEKRWTEEKMYYREGRMTVWSKASDSGPIRRLWNLVLSTLEFHDTIVSSFDLIPEGALASNVVFTTLLLFYFIIACILTFKRNQEISGEWPPRQNLEIKNRTYGDCLIAKTIIRSGPTSHCPCCRRGFSIFNGKRTCS